MRKIREKCSENFVNPSKKTKVAKNRQSHNSAMINFDLRQTSLKKSMNDFGLLFGGTHRNSSMEAPGLTNLIKPSVLEYITHQSTEEIKVPKKMVTDKVKRCRNWSTPGKDKICNYWIKGLESTHELLGRVLEQFINGQLAIPNWFTGGRTVMLDKKKRRRICS